MAVPSVLIAAPSSGSGKTTLTLALLRACYRQGISVASFKVGPDYIDPAFHALASNRECYNIDPWAMGDGAQARILEYVSQSCDLVIGEAVMGLFDGARDGTGSSADLAAQLGIPIILVIDAKGQAASVGALLHGFNSYRPDTKISGVIFNKVGSKSHEKMLGAAADALNIPVLGYVPKSDALTLEHRHLGLVQAREKEDLENFLNMAADIIDAKLDMNKLQSITAPYKSVQSFAPTTPLGQRISVARDDAFAFCYPHHLADWRRSGTEISFFSPLEDEAPSTDADFIYLPGGYPELFAERISHASNFMNGLQSAATRGINIYGECGGFMALGSHLIDATGSTFPMANLLPVTTSFAKPKLHLGYRNATLQTDNFLGPKGECFKAHEFHYASTIEGENSNPLFSLTDANGDDQGLAGIAKENVAGSFIHLIDRA